MRRLYALLFVLAFSFTALIVGTNVYSQAGRAKPARAEGRILIKMRSGIEPWDEPGIIGDQVLAARPARISSLDVGGEREGLYVVELDSGVTVEEAIAQALQDPRVEYAEPDYLLYTRAVPNDPHFDLQWGLFNTGASFGKPGA
ncbi:MAG TPA: hypothetical protein VNO14_03745, partial [Blastocatellia bacterium]|nr:hypothetical protein [Blastocatellia bacterium]